MEANPSIIYLTEALLPLLWFLIIAGSVRLLAGFIVRVATIKQQAELAKKQMEMASKMPQMPGMGSDMKIPNDGSVVPIQMPTSRGSKATNRGGSR